MYIEGTGTCACTVLFKLRNDCSTIFVLSTYIEGTHFRVKSSQVIFIEATGTGRLVIKMEGLFLGILEPIRRGTTQRQRLSNAILITRVA